MRHMMKKPRWARKRDRLQRREAKAAPSQPDAAPTEAPASLWAMSPAEWRLLMITFAGGLASVVVGAAVLGLAVAAAKLVRLSLGNPVAWIPPVGLTIAAAYVFVGELTWARRKTRFNVWWIGLCLFFLFLVWIGLAIGIGAG